MHGRPLLRQRHRVGYEEGSAMMVMQSIIATISETFACRRANKAANRQDRFPPCICSDAHTRFDGANYLSEKREVFSLTW
jgi:hypothetical protein